MSEQISTVSETANGVGGIFLWALVSVTNGAFISFFNDGVFYGLKYPTHPEVILKWFGIPATIGTFVALLWWRRGDGSVLWGFVSIAVGPLIAVFLLVGMYPPSKTLLTFTSLKLVALPIAAGAFAGVRWWRRDND